MPLRTCGRRSSGRDGDTCWRTEQSDLGCISSYRGSRGFTRLLGVGPRRGFDAGDLRDGAAASGDISRPDSGKIIACAACLRHTIDLHSSAPYASICLWQDGPKATTLYRSRAVFDRASLVLYNNGQIFSIPARHTVDTSRTAAAIPLG